MPDFGIGEVEMEGNILNSDVRNECNFTRLIEKQINEARYVKKYCTQFS